MSKVIKNKSTNTSKNIQTGLIFQTSSLSIAAAASSLLIASAVCSPLHAKTIEWPADSVQWRASELPGYSLALQKCSTCHSAHYAEYQPPTAASGYWKAQVLRMKNVFKAPISDEEAQSVVEYLSQTYGASRK